MKMKIQLPIPQYQSVCPSKPRVTLTLDKAIEYELKHGRRLDCNMDRKRLRRTISNRFSAQRSRLKKAQYISDMENMVKDLEEMISVVRPQIKSYKEKLKRLLLQNDLLQKLIEIRSNESKLREMELMQKRIEVDKLKQVEKNVNKYHHEFNHGSQQMQELSLNLSSTELYPSIPSCTDGLQHLLEFGSNQDCQQQFPCLVESGLRMPPNYGSKQPRKDQRQCIMIKLPVEELLIPERNQEEANIDQYLNFEALNVDPLK